VVDENSELVLQCEHLLIAAKARVAAGDLAEAKRLLAEAQRVAEETARLGVDAVFVPALGELASWEPPVESFKASS
jgi:hypothetical protein